MRWLREAPKTLRGRLASLGERDRRALLLGAAVLLPALLWAGAVRPYTAALQDVRDRLSTERALLAREQGLVATAAELPARLTDAERLAAASGERLVRASNRPLAEAALTGTLEHVASASRVLLQGVRGVEPVDAPTAPAGVVAVQVAVQGESDVAGLTRFLHRIESSPLLMRVRALDVRPRAGSGRERAGPAPEEMGVVAFSFVVEAYAPAEIEDTDDGRAAGIAAADPGKEGWIP
ncbi:MAG: type II secretion system protein GspM [Gemmatimonadota bacterium]